MYTELTGRPSYPSAAAVPEGGHNPALLVLTPPCPDYSSSATNPLGSHGDKGGVEFTKSPELVMKIRPYVVFIEEVATAINFDEDLIGVLMGLQECNMAVHACVTSMQQYGDLENSWRLVIVGIHESLGLWAKNFVIPVGNFSDSVSYCAEDVALDTQEIPERFRRIMKEYEVSNPRNKPGFLRKVSQTKPGHGHSSKPNAGYDLRGMAPKCTTYGAGRHKPKGWKPGDGGDVSYMMSARCPQGVRKVSAKCPLGVRKVSARFPQGFRKSPFLKKTVVFNYVQPPLRKNGL